jgi:hypothetical protein
LIALDDITEFMDMEIDVLFSRNFYPPSLKLKESGDSTSSNSYTTDEEQLIRNQVSYYNDYLKESEIVTDIKNIVRYRYRGVKPGRYELVLTPN